MLRHMAAANNFEQVYYTYIFLISLNLVLADHGFLLVLPYLVGTTIVNVVFVNAVSVLYYSALYDHLNEWVLYSKFCLFNQPVYPINAFLFTLQFLFI